MSKKDTVSKKYLQDSKRFADLFNFYLYDGKQVIKPEQLKPLDTAEIALPYGKRTKSSTIQKQRDIIKAVTAMTDDEYTYLLLASELQSEQHYAMPIKNMLYDAIQYSDQIAQITKIHKENDDKYNDNGEYLSGFMKSDRLIPVITLTVYFGASKWGAPTSLHEMLMVKDSSILQFIPDYKIKRKNMYLVNLCSFFLCLILAKYFPGTYSAGGKRLLVLLNNYVQTGAFSNNTCSTKYCIFLIVLSSPHISG